MNVRSIGLSTAIFALAVTMQPAGAATSTPHPKATPKAHLKHKKKPTIVKAVAPSRPGPVVPH